MSTIAQRRRSCRAMVLRLGATRPSPIRSMDARPVHLGGRSSSWLKGDTRGDWPVEVRAGRCVTARRRRVVSRRSRPGAEPASRCRRRRIPPTSSLRPRHPEPSRWPGGEQDRSWNGARTGLCGGRWTGHRGRAEHDGRWAPRRRPRNRTGTLRNDTVFSDDASAAIGRPEELPGASDLIETQSRVQVPRPVILISDDEDVPRAGLPR